MQSLGSALLQGGLGAISGGLRGGLPGALIFGGIGFIGGFASTYLTKRATEDALGNLPQPGSAVVPGAIEPKFGGYTVSRRGAALSHQVIYGETKVGGVIVFDDASGADNKYLSRIIAFAGHEIDSFQQIYMGKYLLSITGDNVTSAQEVDENGQAVGSATTKFNNYIKVRRVLGNHTTSLNGTAPTNFSNKWTSNHKLLGIAHLAIVFEYADDVWEEGLPEIAAKIRGKKVYDPRTSTTAWSDNPALIVRDFLTNDDYGLGEDSANIDDTLIQTAANVCEETVTDGNRYTANGAWVTSQAPIDVLTQLMTSCAGMLWYAQGEWRFKAGDYVAPTVTLTEDDLRSPLSVVTRHSRRDNFNGVRGTFRGPQTNYQFTDYPKVSDTGFVTVDGGEEVLMDLTLPFTDTSEQAQRLAIIALEKNREQISVTGTFGLRAFALQVGDNVQITNSRFGWTNKVFEVVGWSFGIEDLDIQVNLSLRETNANVYNEYLNVTGFESNNTNLPGSLGAVTGGDVNSTTNVTGLTASGGVREIYINWTNPINNDFAYTKVYVNTTNNFSTATQLGGSSNNITGESTKHTGLSANDTRYYWAQAYTSSGTLGNLAGPASATVKDITTDDIENDAVTEDKIAANAVTNTQIASQAVQTGSIFPAAVVTDKIGDNAVSELAGAVFSATSVPTSGGSPGSISDSNTAVFSTTISNSKACEVVLVASFELEAGTPASSDILYFEASLDGETSGAAFNFVRSTGAGIPGDHTVTVFKSNVGSGNFNIKGRVYRSSSSSTNALNASAYLIVHRLFK